MIRHGEKFFEVERHLARASEAVGAMTQAHSVDDLRRAWEDVVASLGRAIGKMITIGLEYEASRPWAHRLKRSSTHDDPGLAYLRAVRNVAEHGLRPLSHFHDPYVTLGQVGTFGGSPHLVFSNCTISDESGAHQIDYLDIKMSEGRISSLTGNSDVLPSEIPAQIELHPVSSEDGRRTFDVPTSIGNHTLETRTPSELSVRALELLQAQLEELRTLLRS